MNTKCGSQNNVYIGARYVPRILGEWSADMTYEPLDVVLYQGTSYTSRTYVPKGIIPSESTQQYWALTGNYNAQVEMYRQEVENYKNQVEYLKSKISYSFSNVSLLKQSEDLIIGNVAQTLGYYSSGDGGSALYLITNVKDETNYQEELSDQLYATLITNLSNIKCYGARNDENYDSTTNIQNCINNSSEVIIPSGTYGFKNLSLRENSYIHGSGTLLYVETPSESKVYYPIIASECNNIIIENITIDGNINNKIYDDKVFTVCDLLTISGKNVRINNVSFINACDSGLMFSECEFSEVSNCYFNYSNDCGIYGNANDLENSTLMFNIHDNIFENCKRSAIALKRTMAYGQVKNNLMYNCTNGVTIEHVNPGTYGKNIDIFSNYIKNCSGYGINTRGGKNHNLNNNRIENAQYSVIIEGCTNVNVNNNIIEVNGTKTYTEIIRLINRDSTIKCENINISSNIINGNSTRAIIFNLNNGAVFDNININNNQINTGGVSISVPNNIQMTNCFIVNNNCNGSLSYQAFDSCLINNNNFSSINVTCPILIDNIYSYGSGKRRVFVSNSKSLTNTFNFKTNDIVELLNIQAGQPNSYYANGDGLGSEVLKVLNTTPSE